MQNGVRIIHSMATKGDNKVDTDGKIKIVDGETSAHQQKEAVTESKKKSVCQTVFSVFPFTYLFKRFNGLR